MSEPSEVLAETVAKRIAKGCEVRHERIERLETLAAKTAQVVHGHGIRLDDMDERLSGLSQAHSATLMVVESSNHAINRLCDLLDKLQAWREDLQKDYEDHKAQFMLHKVDNASDKYSLPRVALWLWVATLTAAGSVLAFFVAEWHEIGALLSRIPWK